MAARPRFGGGFAPPRRRSNPDVFARVYAYADTYGDGFGAGTATAFCNAGETPDGYSLSATDCDPNDETRWRSAAYLGVDADATLWRYMVLYPDLDGDGIGTTPRIGATCIGATIPDGTSIFGFDPDDTDPDRREDAAAEASILAQ